MEINKIYNENCLETMAKMPNNFLDCIITSPPYNKSYWSKNQNINNGFKTKSRKIDYGVFDDCLLPEVYEHQQRQLLNECLRVIKPTGSIFYNHIDILNCHNTIHPKYVYDFPIKQIIIWDRKNTPKLDDSYFFPITEYIFWIKKSIDCKPYFNRNAIFQKKNIWTISPENSNNHPAPFPLEIANNCLLAVTKKGDLIYDPYMGSGTVAVSCVKFNRNYIGSEINGNYILMAEKRINVEKNQLKLF